MSGGDTMLEASSDGVPEGFERERHFSWPGLGKD
jgi:hypothetical protein